MRSNPLRGLQRLFLLLSIPLAVTGCAATPPIQVTLAALDCSKLVPPSYLKPVAGTPLPAADATVGQIWISLDDQTNRLDQANGRTSDLAAIAKACQAQQQAVVASLQSKPWWIGLLFWRSAK